MENFDISRKLKNLSIITIGYYAARLPFRTDLRRILNNILFECYGFLKYRNCYYVDTVKFTIFLLQEMGNEDLYCFIEACEISVYKLPFVGTPRKTYLSRKTPSKYFSMKLYNYFPSHVVSRKTSSKCFSIKLYTYFPCRSFEDTASQIAATVSASCTR